MKVWRPQFENFIQNIHTYFYLDGFVNRQNFFENEAGQAATVNGKNKYLKTKNSLLYLIQILR